MPSVPGTPDPESGPPARPATGRRRVPAVPRLSVGGLDDVRPGSLLVAMPSLTDPTFAGTVVYVLDHSDTGTLGVVLGRPSQVETSRPSMSARSMPVCGIETSSGAVPRLTVSQDGMAIM